MYVKMSLNYILHLFYRITAAISSILCLYAPDFEPFLRVFLSLLTIKPRTA